MRWRLSVLMFLQYAPAGAVLPLYSVQLQTLGFDPFEMAWCCATQALAALLGPLVAGQIADRYVSAERCVAACAFASGVLLWLLANLTSPGAVFLATLGFWMVMTPVFTLGTSLSFAHLPRPDRDFGWVRMFGTIGWVCSGWMLWYWFRDPAWLCEWVGYFRPEQPRHLLTDAYRAASLLSFALALYALTLPHTPPQRHPSHWLAPVAALRLLRARPFAVYFAAVLLLYITVPFTTQVTPLLLKAHGVPQAWLPAVLTMAQLFEVVSLGVLPIMLLCLGVRGTMILGLTAWLISLSAQTLGQPLWLVVGSISLNGLYVTCFIVAGQVFVNRHAHGEIRASTQALLTFMVGVGLLLGNLLVGWVRELADEAFRPTFAVPATLAALLLVAFIAGFAEEDSVAEVTLEVPAESPPLAARG